MRKQVMFVIWALVLSWAAKAAGNQCSLAAKHQQLNKARGVGAPCVTDCLLDHLKQPQTEAERFLIYLTAVSDYCAALSSNLALCHSEPLCQVMLLAGNATAQVESHSTRATAADWWQVLTQKTRQECWPDWLRILNQECPGSKHAQVKQCLGNRDSRKATLTTTSRRQLRSTCPQGCMSVHFPSYGYVPYDVPTCLPPWMLHQSCGSRACLMPHDGAASDQQQGAPKETDCKVREAFLDLNSKLEDKTCSVAVAYASSTSMTDFQGSCPHRLAVAQLLRAAPEIFTGHHAGGRCSVEHWVSVKPGLSPVRARARICDMWPLSPVSGADASRDFGTWHEDLEWPPQTLTQAALLRCASGVQHMHDALSSLWKSPALYSKLLEGSGGWSRALPRAGQVCREQCATNSSRPTRPDAEKAWGVLEGALKTYCTDAFASSAPQSASTSADGSKLGCANALLNLKRNWYQHQLLAVMWLLFVLGLLLGLLTLHLVRYQPNHSVSRCKALQGISRVWTCLGSLVKATPPSYHPSSLPCDQDKSSSSCCTVSLGLRIICACWFVAQIAMDVSVFVLLLVSSGGAGFVENAVFQRLWWYLVVMSAPAGVTMLLVVPSVLAAYGILDFARVRFSLGCCVLLFFSFAWVLFLLVVGMVGGWFIVVADMYMLVALCGVPHHKLLGNKLNVDAYTTLRFLCQGLLQALPSALISTAAIDALIVTTPSPFDPVERYVNGVLWASLLLSLSRFAWEVLSLAALTHKLRAPCFVTAVVDVVHHLQPRQASPPNEVADRLHHIQSDSAGLASIAPGHTQAQAASTGSKGAPAEQAAFPEHGMPAQQPAAASAQAEAVPEQTAMQLHSSSAAGEGASCCSSWCGQGCWPQQYPKFTLVHVWVVSLLAGAFVCVVCSHIIWPWLVFDIASGDSSSYGPLPAAAVRHYSLFGLWGNWRLSGSAKGSLAALGSCDMRHITCNLTAPSFSDSNSAGSGLYM